MSKMEEKEFLGLFRKFMSERNKSSPSVSSTSIEKVSSPGVRQRFRSAMESMKPRRKSSASTNSGAEPASEPEVARISPFAGVHAHKKPEPSDSMKNEILHHEAAGLNQVGHSDLNGVKQELSQTNHRPPYPMPRLMMPMGLDGSNDGDDLINFSHVPWTEHPLSRKRAGSPREQPPRENLAPFDFAKTKEGPDAIFAESHQRVEEARRAREAEPKNMAFDPSERERHGENLWEAKFPKPEFLVLVHFCVTVVDEDHNTINDDYSVTPSFTYLFPLERETTLEEFHTASLNLVFKARAKKMVIDGHRVQCYQRRSSLHLGWDSGGSAPTLPPLFISSGLSNGDPEEEECSFREALTHMNRRQWRDHFVAHWTVVRESTDDRTTE